MGRTSKSRPKLKNAWIDEGERIISFTQLKTGTMFLAEEALFWDRILHLMRSGYRMQ